MMLNELFADLPAVLPPTDSRLRPDIRKLEEGDLGQSHVFYCSFSLAVDVHNSQFLNIRSSEA